MSLIGRFRAEAARDPGSAAALANLGLALKQTGQSAAAIAVYRRALRLAPGHAQIHNNLGSALQLAGSAEDAVASYRKALILAPGMAGPYHNLGGLRRDRGYLDEAVPDFHRALWIEPEHPDLHGGLAVLEHYRERLDLAFPAYRRAVALQPERHDFHTNLGNALRQAGHLASAEAAYRRALVLAPGQGDAQFNLGLLQLTTGRLREGWRNYESRWETRQLAHERRAFTAPLWRGEAAPGKVLLLHAEQGFGDTLQFCRYAALAKGRGLRVVLEVQPPLRRLLTSLAGCDLVVSRGDPLPAFDFQCPLLSLPMMLGTNTLADIPASIPYIHAEPAAVALPGEGPRIGVAWAGAPRTASPALRAFDRRRSLPFTVLAPLLSVPGVRFVSLQKGHSAGPGLIDFRAEMTDFADTAALMANLDLVISADTAVAHLAGALGKPVWLLNRFDSDWRWMADGETTPWYPTMRIFRQRVPGDWDEVIEEVARALARVQSSA